MAGTKKKTAKSVWHPGRNFPLRNVAQLLRDIAHNIVFRGGDKGGPAFSEDLHQTLREALMNSEGWHEAMYNLIYGNCLRHNVPGSRYRGCRASRSEQKQLG